VLDVKDASCKNVKVYIADVTAYGLIVYDYATKSAWRIENNLVDFITISVFKKFNIEISAVPSRTESCQFHDRQ
jgi:Major royal jelly protein